MTGKQRRFADEYLVDFNGTRAYQAAYTGIVKDSTAARAAVRLLRRDDVREYIEGRVKEQQEKFRVRQDDVLRGFMEIAFPEEHGEVSVRERLRALEMLGRHLGLFSKKKDELDIAEQMARIERMRESLREKRENERVVTVRFEDMEGEEQ